MVLPLRNVRLVVFHFPKGLPGVFFVSHLTFEKMERLREKAAGIDIGARKVFVSIDGDEVRSFFTFTQDFENLRKYLVEHGIETVAMEATGVYWGILYEMLEEAGIDVWLVDGAQTKQVPGRKTDVKDCQWIRELHSYGLLNRCFVAESDVKELRTYQRLREDHIRSASMHINHMQKALTEMNIRLPEVLNQVHGVSGLAIIQAILNGERDKEKLLSLCVKRVIKTKGDEVLKSLNGRYTKSGLFALRQALDSYQFYQNQIKQCDTMLQEVIKRIGKGKPDQRSNITRKPIRHNKPEIDNFGTEMLKIFDGKDATSLSGITDYSWMQLFSETGTDLSKWETEKHFTSWLGLAPGQHTSGKMKKNKRKKSNPKAGQIFRTIAQSLLNSKKIALGAFGRRLRSRKGSAIAIKAVARKLAIMYWRMMVKGTEFVETGIQKYEEQLIAQKQRSLTRLAKELKMQVISYV
jgi:transposase